MTKPLPARFRSCRVCGRNFKIKRKGRQWCYADECTREGRRRYELWRRRRVNGTTPEMYNEDRQPIPNLKITRHNLRLSLREFSKISGVSSQAISTIENGKKLASKRIREKIHVAVKFRQRQLKEREARKYMNTPVIAYSKGSQPTIALERGRRSIGKFSENTPRVGA